MTDDLDAMTRVNHRAEIILRDTRIALLEQQVEGLEQENRELRQRLIDVGEWTGRHQIEIRTDGFTIMHPLKCRPNLFDCIYNYEAAQLDPDDHDLGRFYCSMDGGSLVIQEAT
jgi:hypothetical protein